MDYARSQAATEKAKEKAKKKTKTTPDKKADVYVLPHLVAWPRRPLKTKGSRNALKMSDRHVHVHVHVHVS